MTFSQMSAFRWSSATVLVIEGIQTKMGHDAFGCDWTNAFDESTAKILLQASQGRWFRLLSELLAILGMVSPEPGQAQGLSCGNRGEMAHNRDQILFRRDLEPSHGIAGMLVVVSEPFDDALQMLCCRARFWFE